jgi:hypothetical protein
MHSVEADQATVKAALAAADALVAIPEPLPRAEAGTDVELRRLNRGQAAGGPRTR